MREADRDRYLATLLAPQEKQDGLFSLYAFAAEIARIPLLVSEPALGEIRMQWWLDTLDAISRGEAVDHPVAQSLRDVVLAHKLPVEPLQNLIEARKFDLYADQFPTAKELEGYLGETESVLMQLAAIVLDPAKAVLASAAIGSAGVAFGLARLLARDSLPGKFLPPGATKESLRGLAVKRLAEARQQSIPGQVFPAVLPVALTELYLKGMPSALQRQWVLWRASKKKYL